jgi:hypothetical protein
MHSNYMLADFIGTLKAALIFPLFVFVPGFVAGFSLDLFRFRARRPLTQFLLSTPLSLAICPICTFLLGRYGGYGAIWAVYGIVWAVFVVMAAKIFRWPMLIAEFKAGKAGLLVVAIWVIIAITSLINLQFGEKLYFSVSAYDHCVRAAFTSALTRNIPPSNPYFSAFGSVPLRYHYFWMMMCALPAKLLGMQPLHAMYGGTIWIGIALLSTIVLFLKFFLKESVNLSRKAILGAGLLLVTGLDIFPTMCDYLIHHRVAPDIEWWNDVQVTSWADSLIWVPHYLAALIACLIGFLALWEEFDGNSTWRQVAAVMVASAAFASATGLGIYVAFVFSIFLTLWIGVCVVRNWLNQASLTIASGVLALLCALPYLHSMQVTGTGGSGTGAGGSGKFAQFEIRVFSPFVLYLYRHGVANLTLLRLASFVALPLNYLMELGFFFLVGCLRGFELRKCGEAMDRKQVAGWTMVGASLLVGSFVASTTITSNDLGMRVMLPAQFILLLWAIPLLDGIWFGKPVSVVGKGTQWALMATLALGVFASFFQLLDLRFFPLLMDHKEVEPVPWMATDQKLGQRTMSLREAFEAVQSRLPKDALIQSNPVSADYVPVTLYADRASAAEGANCGAGFGGDPAKCGAAIGVLKHLFDEPEETDGMYLDQVCRAFSISALVVKDTDRVWQQRGWVWTRRPIFANDFVRVLSCGLRSGELEAQH